MHSVSKNSTPHSKLFNHIWVFTKSGEGLTHYRTIGEVEYLCSRWSFHSWSCCVTTNWNWTICLPCSPWLLMYSFKGQKFRVLVWRGQNLNITNSPVDTRMQIDEALDRQARGLVIRSPNVLKPLELQVQSLHTAERLFKAGRYCMWDLALCCA
jgi:hypothetical protein